MAFPFGVIDREQAIDAIASAPPWSRFEISDARVIRLGEDAAVVVDRVRPHREGQAKLEAVVSSSFVRADDSWQLAYHQKSPSI